MPQSFDRANPDPLLGPKPQKPSVSSLPKPHPMPPVSNGPVFDPWQGAKAPKPQAQFPAAEAWQQYRPHSNPGSSHSGNQCPVAPNASMHLSESHRQALIQAGQLNSWEYPSFSMPSPMTPPQTQYPTSQNVTPAWHSDGPNPFAGVFGGSHRPATNVTSCMPDHDFLSAHSHANSQQPGNEPHSAYLNASDWPVPNPQHPSQTGPNLFPWHRPQHQNASSPYDFPWPGQGNAHDSQMQNHATSCHEQFPHFPHAMFSHEQFPNAQMPHAMFPHTRFPHGHDSSQTGNPGYPQIQGPGKGNAAELSGTDSHARLASIDLNAGMSMLFPPELRHNANQSCAAASIPAQSDNFTSSFVPTRQRPPVSGVPAGYFQNQGPAEFGLPCHSNAPFRNAELGSAYSRGAQSFLPPVGEQAPCSGTANLFGGLQSAPSFNQNVPHVASFEGPSPYHVSRWAGGFTGAAFAADDGTFMPDVSMHGSSQPPANQCRFQAPHIPPGLHAFPNGPNGPSDPGGGGGPHNSQHGSIPNFPNIAGPPNPGGGGGPQYPGGGGGGGGRGGGPPPPPPPHFNPQGHFPGFGGGGGPPPGGPPLGPGPPFGFGPPPGPGPPVPGAPPRPPGPGGGPGVLPGKKWLAPPAWTPGATGGLTFRQFLWQLQNWSVITGMLYEDRGTSLAMSLGGRAQRIAMSIPSNVLQQRDGLAILVAELEYSLGSELQDLCRQAGDNFDEYKRPRHLNASEFLVTFEGLYYEAVSHGLSMNRVMLSQRLISKLACASACF